jgi:hypothetical protein
VRDLAVRHDQRRDPRIGRAQLRQAGLDTPERRQRKMERGLAVGAEPGIVGDIQDELAPFSGSSDNKIRKQRFVTNDRSDEDAAVLRKGDRDHLRSGPAAKVSDLREHAL